MFNLSFTVEPALSICYVVTFIIMECAISTRPHTVATMAKPSMFSDNIMKLLEEIEKEATSSPSKPSK